MTPLYHGSSEVFPELEGGDPGYSGSLGYGLYLTTEFEFARVFGKHVHELASPVPDDLVLDLTELWTHDCGDSLIIYTPGSMPFTFNVLDRRTGASQRYSVLEDCEESVKAGLATQALAEYRPSGALKAAAQKVSPMYRGSLSTRAYEVLTAMEEGLSVDDAIEAALDKLAKLGLDEKGLETVGEILADLSSEAEAFAEAQVEERLGIAIGLDELTQIAAEHGYSALHISGYAPGDEYVIFDETYLPVPVLAVHSP